MKNRKKLVALLAGFMALVMILSLILSFFHEEMKGWGAQPHIICLWISVGLSLLAMGVYAAGAWKQLHKS